MPALIGESLLVLHWELEPAEVQQLLPEPLRVDTLDGSAWVSLIIGRAAWFRAAVVRTYVTGPDGTAATLPLSVDVSNAVVAVAAHVAGGYRQASWSTVSVERGEATVAYSCRRRWPTSHPAASRALVRVGSPRTYDVLDRFVTARAGVYVTPGGCPRLVPVTLKQWQLCDAELLHLDDELLSAAGVPEPDDRLTVRYAPRVDAKLGRRTNAD